MKAVVLETRGRKAAVLAKDGVVRVVHGRYNVGDVIDYGEAARPSVRQWIAAGVAMVMLVGASAGLWADRNYTAYAEVSLDVNPSMVFTVNKRDRVLGVRAINEDAEAIVAQLEQSDIRFSTVSDAVEQALSLMDDEGYLNEANEDYVLINVSADDDARQERLSEAVETAMEHTRTRDATIEYRIDHSDRRTARAAKDNGVSAGRYAAWQQDLDDSGDGEEAPALEDYAKKPVRELLSQRDADKPTADTREGSDERPEISPSDGPDSARPEDKPDNAKPSDDPENAKPDGDLREARADSKPEVDLPEITEKTENANDTPQPDGTESAETRDVQSKREGRPGGQSPATDEIPPTGRDADAPVAEAQERQDMPSEAKQASSGELADPPNADIKESSDKPSEDNSKPSGGERKAQEKPSEDSPKPQDNSKHKAPSDSKPEKASSSKPGGGSDVGQQPGNAPDKGNKGPH